MKKLSNYNRHIIESIIITYNTNSYLSNKVDKKWIVPLSTESRRETLHVPDVIIWVYLFYFFQQRATHLNAER